MSFGKAPTAVVFWFLVPNSNAKIYYFFRNDKKNVWYSILIQQNNWCPVVCVLIFFFHRMGCIGVCFMFRIAFYQFLIKQTHELWSGFIINFPETHYDRQVPAFLKARCKPNNPSNRSSPRPVSQVDKMARLTLCKSGFIFYGRSLFHRFYQH